MKITPKPDISDAELLAELSAMSWDELMSVPLTGRFSGIFEAFSEMSETASQYEAISVTANSPFQIRTEAKLYSLDISSDDFYVEVNILPEGRDAWKLTSIQMRAA